MINLIKGMLMFSIFIPPIRPIDPVDPPWVFVKNEWFMNESNWIFPKADDPSKKAKTTQVKTYSYTDVTGDVLFVGDSRTVGMHNTVGDAGATWICKVGATYTWLNTTEIITLEDGDEVEYCPNDAIIGYLTAVPTATVYFNLGVNDPGDKVYYCTYINNLAAMFPEADINYVSVNPVEDDLITENGYYIHNEHIDEFNAYMKQNVITDWIECHDYMLENGFGTVDGLHYDANTYRMIFSYITGGKE